MLTRTTLWARPADAAVGTVAKVLKTDLMVEQELQHVSRTIVADIDPHLITLSERLNTWGRILCYWNL